jgi:3-deoxy-D-manno-octulosonic-acid transferase
VAHRIGHGMTLTFFLLYNLFLVPLYLVFKITGFFNAKIKMTLKGRRGLFDKLAVDLQQIPADSRRLWIHISSMGEFEQGAPLIEELLSRFPDAWIIVSLFSPSVYKHLDYRQERTITTYLPFDLYHNSARFISMVKPSIHMIVRHDIWPNVQWILQKKRIPSLLVDASFSEKSYRSVKMLRRLYRQIYSTFTAICVVSNMNKERTLYILPKPDNVFLCGDTRYDRVYARAMDTQKIDFLKSLDFERAKCLVMGSSWPEDEKVILPAILKAFEKDDKFSLILAPHEISESHLLHLERKFADAGILSARLSVYKNNAVDGIRVLFIDSIGLLANVYALGSIAYVGGAFGAGVHSVLEPAAHGVVVSYGPLHLNSPEAKEMTEDGVGHPVSRTEEFETLLFEMLNDPSKCAELGAKTKKYVLRNVGASQRTADVVEKIFDF